MPKPESRMERKKGETQRRIIAVAVELFNQNGLQAVTMEQIADAADVARGTLYNYFPSKDVLISAYIQVTFQDRQENRAAHLRALPDTRTRMSAVFNSLIDGVRRQREIFEAFMVYRMKRIISFRPPEEADRSGLELLIGEVVRLGRESGELRADLPEDVLYGLFEYAFIAAVKPLFLQVEDYDQAGAVQSCVDLFMNGAAAH